MALRRPLVVVSGRVQELPVGDSLPASVSLVAKYAITGTLTIQTGSARWYPDRSITISAAYFSVGTAPSGGSAIIDIKKNGTSIFSGSKPTISSGQNLSTTISGLSVSLTSSDYLTVDVNSANGAADATSCIVYT